MSKRPIKRPTPGRPPARRVVKKKPTAAAAPSAKAPKEEAKKEEKVVAAAPVSTGSSEPTPKKVEKKEKPKKQVAPAAAATASHDDDGGKDHNNKALPVLLIAVIIILVGISAYFFAELASVKDEHEKTRLELSDIEKVKDEQIEAKSKELEGILSKYDEIKLERAHLGADNKQLNDEVDGLRKQVYSLRNRLKQANSSNGGSSSGKSLTAAEKAKFSEQMQALIETHKAALAERDKEIKRLKHINKKLHHEVKNLVEKQGHLVDNIENLEERIVVASRLYIEKTKVGYKTTKGTVEYDELDEFKAKKIDKLKVGFVISDNKIAEKGYKNFKVSIVGPDKKILFDAGKGGGNFEDADGKTVFYTTEKEVKFDNDLEEVNFFITQSDDYKKGEYHVTIYAEDRKVGEKKFTII